MKQHKLKIIIALMSLAVIGLILVQLYWISNMVRTEEEQFKRNVNSALLETAERLEKKDAAKAIIKKFSGGKSNFAFFVQHDSSKDITRPKDSTMKIQIVRVEPGNNDFKYEVKYFNKNDSLKHILKSTAGSKVSILNHVPTFTIDKKDTLQKKHTTLVQNVFTEIVDVGLRKKIEDRLNTGQLNNMLEEILRNRGIETDFYFGVHKAKDNNLTLVKQGADTLELKNSNYRTQLFPAEIFTDENQLLIYFPNQKSYLIKSIAGMLGLSIGLILIIVWVFYKSIEMFLKQKKITEVKNDLINNITHEFKTPISTISLACEALNEPSLLIEKDSVARYSNIIKEENDRLKVMVDSLLNAAAMEKDEINLSKDKIDLHEIIRSSVSKYLETIRMKNGNFTLQLNAQNFFIEGDEFHLTNIISNLIDNAIKYNERDPDITISTENNDKSILIKIKDNGIGIAREHFGKIFETFFRVSNGNIQNARGNGIGLSYVKKSIEAHHGSINLTSEINSGSEFVISFPLQEL